MDGCFCEWFLYNGSSFKQPEFALPGDFDFSIYEVIRVIRGVAIFLDDHLERLALSAKLQGIDNKFTVEEIKSEINQLISLNNCAFGNIKYAIFLKNSEIKRFAYCMAHTYPIDNLYKTGVHLISLQAERNSPNAKLLHANLKPKIDKILTDKSIYEVALVRMDNCVTEGSKSNLFFIKNNVLYTAPDETVLKGITRKYVIQIAKELNISIQYEAIKYLQLNNFNNAFLTGTSPKILPVRSIDKFNFVNNSELLKIFMDKYDDKIEQYISQLT